MTEIAIVGGGIAGLSAALSLHAVGLREVAVFEAAPEIQPVGAGLNIMPNAVRELAALGVYEELAAAAVLTRELRYYHCSGGLIQREPRGLNAGYAWPQLSIHRAELQRVLADAVRERLGEGALRPGVRITNPAGLRADIIIGADGIRSVVRAAHHPGEGPPPWNGMLVWRGVSWLEAGQAPEFMFIAGDDRQKCVLYPMLERSDGRTLVNWALAMPADEGEGARADWNRPVPVSKFLHHYKDWEFDGVEVAPILAAAEGAYEYPMVDRDPLARWTHGRCTLIGDAAHAMYPIGSNGATQSIVDGRALAHALAVHGAPAAGLAAYEAERRPAMTALQLANRRQGPEVVINLAHERAPRGFTDIEEVIPAAERAEIASRYAVAGAFDAEAVNAGSPYAV